jgi:2-keto-4-pentenoate hydratase
MASDQEIAAHAARLREAARNRLPIPPIRQDLGERDIAAAYLVQRANVSAALTTGDRITGRKIGLTSLAVQRQLGVNEPDFGTLLASMEMVSDDEVPAQLIQPKAEAEVAFVLGRDLRGERISFSELLAGIDCALAAIEIVDSRIARWDIGIVDTVADNASSARYVLGTEPISPRSVDLRLAGMVLEKNGEPLSFGAGAACLGHPLRSALWLARKMARSGTPLAAGDVILSGALGPMLEAAPGDVFEARISGVGTVRTRFAAEPAASSHASAP